MKIVGTVLFLLLLFPSLVLGLSPRVEEIRALRTDRPSLLNSYLDLMEDKKLIHQTDIRLKKRQLLKRNGGLCSFTAQVNAIQSVSKYFEIAESKFLERPDFFLYEVIEEARAYMTDDPTYEGAHLYDVEKYTEEVLEEYGLDEIIKIDYVSKKSELLADKFKNYYWKLRVLGLLSKDGSEGHTVVLLKIDTKEQIAYISDPNYPNKVIQVPYIETKKGLELYLSLDFPGFQPALVDEILEVNVLK